MFDIIRYTPARADDHADRFRDHSLMFYRDGGLFALLPANEEGEVLWSHRGLTYGGIIMNEKTTAARVLQLFRELNDYLRAEGFRKVVYKQVPHIFHRIPSEEDAYALTSVCEARLRDRSLSSAILLATPPKWRRDRRYGANKAFADGIVVQESDDWAGFWQVLTGNLQHKYGARPVHTLEEIQLLHARFPHHIRLFTASKEGRLLGGTVLYLTQTVVHTQYISAFDELLHHRQWHRPYFDFGTSNEEDGRILVEPLIYQKEGFGGRGICYDCYEYDL